MKRELAVYDLSRAYGMPFKDSQALLDQAEVDGDAPLPGGAVLTHSPAGGFGVAVAGESEAATAARLGLDRPWAHPDRAGRCPGGAPYGHGLSLTVVHGRGCCASWDQARAAAAAAAEAEPQAGG